MYYGVILRGTPRSKVNRKKCRVGEGRTMPLGFCVPRPTFRSVGLASKKPGFPSCIQSGDGLTDKERIEQGKAFIFRE